MRDEASVLLLTGTVATGKSRIASEIGEILAGGTRPIVIIDLDQLGWAFIPEASSEQGLKLRVDNLAAIWPNLHSAGFRHIVISGAISTQKELHLIREAVGHAVLTVVRLITPPSLLEARLRGRDVGRLLDDHLAVMPTIARSLDQSRI